VPFDIGLPELMMVLFVTLLVFGPSRLPEVGRGAGRALREFRRATEGLSAELHRQLELEEAFRPSALGLRRGCLRCRHINPEDANFCVRCGAGLFAEEPDAVARQAV
jgi:TatA/E family protein of Tat protein translocase